MKTQSFLGRLLHIKNCPRTLYVLGNIDLLNYEYTVGIVGSRDCTEYGMKVTKSFSRELSKNGICIVSGLALGIDATAHNFSCDQIGKTIAVLGCGINKIYPKENEWLYQKILFNDGCIISEHKPDTEGNPSFFPKRNRIISGLSDAILVVEAEHRSGTSITVNYAKEQCKAVYAIPGNIYNRTALGTNRMIKEGALFTTKPDQIIKSIKNQYNKEPSNDEPFSVPAEYSEIYNLLSDTPIHINEIVRKLNSTIPKVTNTLTMMELEGYVTQIYTNQFIRFKKSS